MASAAGLSWPGSCSRAPTTCCWTSPPTISTPTRSSGCGTSSKAYPGGVIVISHDVGLLEAIVTKVFHLDANRAELDMYAMDWKRYLLQRETDEKRRKRERAQRRAQGGAAAQPRPTRCGPRRPRRWQRRTWPSGPSGCWPAGGRARSRQGGEDPAPQAGTLRQDAAEGGGPVSKSYGSLEVFTDVDLAIDRGSQVVVLGLNGAGKTTLLRILAGIEPSDTGEVRPGHGLRLGYYAQEHETLDVSRTVLENMVTASPELSTTDARKILGSFLFTGDDVDKPARVLSGGEKTRLALAMLVVRRPTSCCSTSPPTTWIRPPAARCWRRSTTYAGAVVLVTHDEGAVEALEPDRVLLLPDGVEDLWTPDYADLIALA